MLSFRDLRRFRDPRRLWQRVVLYSKRISPQIPWEGSDGFARLWERAQTRTLVAQAAAYNLFNLARHAAHLDGAFAEVGVYRGGTAYILSQIATSKRRDLHLFDTFTGMPATDLERDLHTAGDFADTTMESVRSFVGEAATFHQGFFPETARGLEEERFSFAHIDVDIHQSVADCCSFFYPRIAVGGVLLFDDYGQRSCPGAKRAVDEFFADKPEPVLHLPTGQALVLKLPRS